MIGRVDSLATYFKIARMTQDLNRFIREASITKSQINISMTGSLSTLSDITGIGKKVDLYA